ncbi:MAG: hydrogenase maturation nickel metallochaperone HypA [Collinsella sp.]
MHELGIVYHIIRDVENVARANGVSRVSSVTLLLGEVSGVVPDLLLDAWRWAADKKSITEGAELLVEPVEAVTHCEACGRDYATVEHGKTCPHCGSGETYLLQGQEVTTRRIPRPPTRTRQTLLLTASPTPPMPSTPPTLSISPNIQ